MLSRVVVLCAPRSRPRREKNQRSPYEPSLRARFMLFLPANQFFELSHIPHLNLKKFLFSGWG